MVYIHTLLIMEDDLDEYDQDLEPTSVASSKHVTPPAGETAETPTGTAEPDPSPSTPVVDWCTCGLCSPYHRQLRINVVNKENALTLMSYSSV